MNAVPPESVAAVTAPSATAPAAPPAWGGAPLRSTLRFLAWPAALGVAIQAFGAPLPPVALYGFAALFGLILFVRTLRDAEWLLAVFTIYIPFSRIYVAPVAPGINGTNALILLMFLAWAVRVLREGGPVFARLPGNALVAWWAVLSLASVVTTGFHMGFQYAAFENLPAVKAWIDQFIIYFVFVNLIRDGAMARRVVIYMMLGCALAALFGLQEWVDKRDYNSIERSRLLGPQLQPNDFGAFLVYGVGPFIALFLENLQRPRAWLLTPYFLLVARVVLATFSRGAYIGMACVATAAVYVRGKLFLALAGALGLAMLVAMPELVPDSLSARVEQSTAGQGVNETLDQSSTTRIVLWQAAVDMTLESPVFGMGFGTFPSLKRMYTAVDVPESDNHNMFLYISSQMGIPALIVFILIVGRLYLVGARLHRHASEPFARAIGLGAAATAAGIVGINMFGSRMVDASVMAYVWIQLAVLAHLWAEHTRSAARPARLS